MTVDQPRLTPNGAVIRITHLMNLGDEPRTMMLAALSALVNSS